MPEAPFGAHVDGDTIYALLLSIDKKVDRIETVSKATQTTVEDHETRIRGLETHGSVSAQEGEKTVISLRARLHVVENDTALNSMRLQIEEEERKATKDTLVRLSLLALSVGGTALAMLVVSLIVFFVTS